MEVVIPLTQLRQAPGASDTSHGPHDIGGRGGKALHARRPACSAITGAYIAASCIMLVLALTGWGGPRLSQGADPTRAAAAAAGARCGPGWQGDRRVAAGSTQAACCRLWADKTRRHDEALVDRRAAAELQAARTPADDFTSRTAYDLYEPTWTCHLERRVGLAHGDGGKWVCGPDRYFAGRDCLVYSVGSNGQMEFETEVRNRLGCEVHTFDPTGNTAQWARDAAALNISFHAVGLAAAAGGHMKPLRDIVAQLGHQRRTIDLLKIDCEGCEHTAFDGIWEDLKDGLYSVGQVQVEVHGKDAGRNAALFDAAEAAGFRVFHKEPNHWGCDGYGCMEFSLIGKQAAWDVFSLSHSC